MPKDYQRAPLWSNFWTNSRRWIKDEPLLRVILSIAVLQAITLSLLLMSGNHRTPPAKHEWLPKPIPRFSMISVKFPNILP